MSEKIRMIIEELIQDKIPIQTDLAIVTAVDLDNATCDVKYKFEEKGETFKVRLKVDQDPNTGFMIVPKVGSLVFVSIVNNDPAWAFVSYVSEVSNIFLNGKQFGGLIKIDQLVSRLNDIEDKINDHSHTVVSQKAKAIDSKISKTKKEDLENDIVSHG